MQEKDVNFVCYLATCWGIIARRSHSVRHIILLGHDIILQNCFSFSSQNTPKSRFGLTFCWCIPIGRKALYFQTWHRITSTEKSKQQNLYIFTNQIQFSQIINDLFLLLRICVACGKVFCYSKETEESDQLLHFWSKLENIGRTNNLWQRTCPVLKMEARKSNKKRS